MKLRAPSSPGNPWLKVGGAVVTGAPAEPNPNLLLWSEACDNAAWAKTATTIFADNALDPGGINATADLVQFTLGTGAIRQTTSVAAASGAGANLGIFDVASDVLTRYEISAVFDGVAYTYSAYLQSNEVGVGGRIRIDRSGGFIRCSFEDVGDAAAFWVAWQQLEVGATATVYVKREGT